MDACLSEYWWLLHYSRRVYCPACHRGYSLPWWSCFPRKRTATTHAYGASEWERIPLVEQVARTYSFSKLFDLLQLTMIRIIKILSPISQTSPEMQHQPINSSGEELESTSSSSLTLSPQQPPSVRLDSSYKLFRIESNGVTGDNHAIRIQLPASHTQPKTSDDHELYHKKPPNKVCISSRPINESPQARTSEKLDSKFQIKPTPASWPSVNMNCICSLCFKTFGSSSSVSRHLRSVHGLVDLAGTKQVYCLLCKTFQDDTQHHLRHLIRAHEMETRAMIAKTSSVNLKVSPSIGALKLNLDCVKMSFKNIGGNTIPNDISKTWICLFFRSGILDQKWITTSRELQVLSMLQSWICTRHLLQMFICSHPKSCTLSKFWIHSRQWRRFTNVPLHCFC